MEKEFIPLHLALKLKALGFDYPCFATWNGDVLDMSLQVPSDDYFTKAPTFSQAFRFFRDKYRQSHIWIMDELIETGEYTYEEAELACLNKLITSI